MEAQHKVAAYEPFPKRSLARLGAARATLPVASQLALDQPRSASQRAGGEEGAALSAACRFSVGSGRLSLWKGERGSIQRPRAALGNLRQYNYLLFHDMSQRW